MKNNISELDKFRNGFYAIMEYFDSISDEEKIELDDKLKKIGL